MSRERPKASRRTSGRRSGVLARGRGDARDHRRENQRLTENDLDLSALRTDAKGRLTVVADQGLVEKLDAAGMVGLGLERGSDGSIQVKLAPTLGYDSSGRVGLRLILDPLQDESEGTPSVTSTVGAIPDPADSPANADALRDDLVANTLPAIRDALATLAAAVNSILAAGAKTKEA